MYRKALAAAALAAATTISAPAFAQCTGATCSFTGTGFATISNGDGVFGDALLPAGKFTDTITFTSSSAGSQSVQIGFLLSTLKGIDNFVARLNGQRIQLVADQGRGKSGSLTIPVVFGQTLTLTISGKAFGGNSSYSGNFSFSAVPEPATWALMIVGLGMIGGTLRRRKIATSVRYSIA